MRWWDAVRRAQWSRAVELRTAMLCNNVLGQTPAVLDHLVRHTVNPRVLISTVEDLVREGGKPGHNILSAGAEVIDCTRQASSR